MRTVSSMSCRGATDTGEHEDKDENGKNEEDARSPSRRIMKLDYEIVFQ